MLHTLLTTSEITSLSPYGEFLQNCESRLTVNTYAQKLSIFHGWLKDAGLEVFKVRPGDLGKFMGQLRQPDGRPYSRASVLSFKNTLGSFYSYLAATEQINHLPTAIFKILRIRKPENKPKPIDEVTEKKLTDSFKYDSLMDMRACAVVVLALYQGMRRDEIKILEWEKINFREHTINILGKGIKTRTLLLHRDTWVILYRLYCRSRYHFGLFPSKHVFRAPNLRNQDRPPSPERINVLFQRAKSWAGLDNHPFTPHWLRHTFGTRLAASGASAYEIRDNMGHASIATSEAYVKTTEKQAKIAYQKAFPTSLEKCQDKKYICLQAGSTEFGL